MISLVEKLILSLTKREKSYFKKLNEAQNFDNLSTNYLTLYNHILKNKKIDKNILIEKKKKILSNISKEKEILVQKILLSLFTFHNDYSIFNKIIKYILFTKILLGKGINENTSKYLKKAKNYAYQNEEFTLILVIIEIEQNLCFNHCFIKDYNKFNELETERFNIIDIINNLNSLIKIKTEIQQFQFNENCYSFDINFFIEKYGHSPLISENEIKSIKAKSIWYYIMFFYYYIKHDYQLAYNFINMQYELFKKHPKCFEKEDYMQLYGNLLYTCALLKKIDTFNLIMEEFKSIKCHSMQDDIYLKRTCYFRTLELYHNLKKYQEASDLAKDAEIFIRKTKIYSENQHNSYLYLLIIRAYIENNDFIDVIKASQKYVTIFGYELYSSIFRLFEFIAHYKLENYENLLYSVNSWAKVISLKRNLFPLEKALIKFFRTVGNKISLTDKKQLLSSTYLNLKEFENNTQKIYLNHYFDFAAWFERELEEMK